MKLNAIEQTTREKGVLSAIVRMALKEMAVNENRIHVESGSGSSSVRMPVRLYLRAVKQCLNPSK